MDLKKLSDKLEKIKLEKETKETLFDVINEKISDNMGKVINAIGALKTGINASIGALNNKIDNSIGALNNKLDTSIGDLRSKNNFIKWLVTAVGAIAALILGKIFKMF